ncbi:flagellar biosynthesis protein FlhF [Paenibacillus sp. MMS18-CY102]|uniref:flagellar biosynthesis protein FlhF n=1 Tax=Paenibacillus sp. MMS18-CY102 TaxID=2682849 RepID=UPI001365EC04|nr:flagellar biosynthesis protein FlhF [Paenibacillus sp. MMS18-CY102]
MRVKTYLVNEVSEAMPLIRTDLGSEAIIISTKVIKIGGFMGMFKKRKTEVVAAVESDSRQSEKGRKAPSAQSAKQAPTRSVASAAAAYAGGNKNALPVGTSQNARPAATAVLDQEDAMNAAERAAAVIQAMNTKPPELSHNSHAATKMHSARTDESQRSQQQPVTQERGESSTRQIAEEALISEIRDMKEWILKLSRQQAAESQPAAFRALRERLYEQEVSTEWIDKLIDELEQLPEAQQGLEDIGLVWKLATNQLTGWLKPSEHSGIASGERVIYFVGPTGVGKTTTIAKLAAEQTIKHGRKVGFITSDTYRIAAVDQLRTYANILNVPMEVVFSPNEVPRAFERLQEQEMILMDTAGRNYRSELHVSEVNSLMNQKHAEGSTYLVLSMTGRTKDMAVVAERFLPYGVKNAVFTKLDETNVYGMLMNLTLEFGLLPAYVTSGQTVPDDIAPFNAESYVALLLGEPVHA